MPICWNSSNDNYKDTWINSVRELLYNNFLGFVWLNQNEVSKDILKQKIKYNLECQFVQTWLSDMNDSSKCDTYRQFKTTFELENYLLAIPRNWRIFIAKFRLSNHKLPIEKGRYTNIMRELRYCELCNDNSLGDEFHLLCKCKNADVHRLRCKYIPRYFVTNPSMHKFVIFMKNIHKRKYGVNLGKFLKSCKQVWL